MLGRKDYTQQELDNATKFVGEQLAAYKKLAKAATASKDPKVASVLDAFEPLFFNNMVMVLDRYFVHRIRPVAGKDTNPLNEVELLANSLLEGNVLHTTKAIKFVADNSVLKLDDGDRIALDPGQFESLADAYFEELDTRFVS